MGEKLFINPAEWASLQVEIAKSSNIMPRPAPMTLFGLPVIISNEVPAGNAVLGDFRGVGKVACGCCYTAKQDGALAPVCACYLQTGGAPPALCPDCERCAFHHKELKFGDCRKPEIVQNVIRTRAREKARRMLEEAPTNGS